MKFKLSIIAMVLAAFLMLGPVSARGQEPYLRDMEVQFLQLVNTARANPLLMAWFLGMNPFQVLADLPGLSDSLLQGLPPLRTDDALTDAARLHTQDMLALNYYGDDSPDGRTPEARILERGYLPEMTGESMGVLGFFNLIDPSEAVLQIFTTLYKDELNPSRTLPRNILNPDLEDVGVGFGAGMLTLGGTLCNAYVVTCDFGKSTVSVLEKELLTLINQARDMNGLPPLVFDSKLHQSATGHCRDMIEKRYLSEQSQDGATPADRIAKTGYEAEATGEIIGSLSSPDDLVAKDAAFRIFAAKFKEELDPGTNTERCILNGAFKDGAVSFEAFQLPVEGDGPGTYGLMVVDLAKSSLPANPSLTGAVFNDVNGDGLYGPGEGIPDAAVTANGSNGPFPVFTNLAGGFTLELDPGLYTVTVDQGGSILERVVELRDENVGIWFNVNLSGEVD